MEVDEVPLWAMVMAPLMAILRCDNDPCVVGTNAVAVIIPDVFTLELPKDAPTPVSAEPSSAGNAPLSFDEDTVVNLASATVPVNWPAGILVRFAPLPVTAPVTLPLKLFAVTIPETFAPVSEKVTVDNPLRFIILFTLISDAIMFLSPLL